MNYLIYEDGLHMLQMDNILHVILLMRVYMFSYLSALIKKCIHHFDMATF